MPNKITLYQVCREFLPEKSPYQDNDASVWNICLFTVKQRLERVEIDQQKIRQIIADSTLAGYAKNLEWEEDLNQAIIAHLENLGKEIK